MKRVFFEGPARFIFFPIAAAAFLSLISLVVMQLWNHLLPDIFHVGAITFWQAMGLFILSKILFGFGKGGGRFGRPGVGAPLMRKRMEERFKNMILEEKALFKEQMKKRMCSPHGWRGFDWEDETATQQSTPNV